MSQDPHRTFNLVREPGGRTTATGGQPPQPEAAQNQTSSSSKDANVADGSDPLFTMYNEMAGDEDGKMAESWKEDADGILVFTGLFSAAVATLVSVAIQDLRPNSQDTSAFYLQNIYLLLADSNRSNVPIPPALSNPPLFSPPRYAVWVNSLWFLSLSISLTCGLLATLLQQWARRYVKSTSRRYSPHKRARIRAFFSEGVEKLHLPWAVEALPTLLHLSLFLFFAGLLIFLFNIHHTIFTTVVWWVGLCTTVYGCTTLMPIFRADSPYYAPLSSSAWFLLHAACFAFTRIFGWFDAFSCLGSTIVGRMNKLEKHCHKCLAEGMEKMAEDAALKISPEIDARGLMRTFDSLDQDHELERFFEGIPGFCSSDVVSNPLGVFIEPNKWRLSEALIVLMQHSLTSNLVSDLDRRRRSLICTKAMHTASLPIHFATCQKIINGEWGGLLNFIEFGHLLRGVSHNDPAQKYYSTCMVAMMIARWKELKGQGFELAADHLGIPIRVVERYVRHGDSLLLANCIHILRNILDVHWDPFGLGNADIRRKILESVSKFDIKGTFPSLQQEFCALWNRIVNMATITHERPVRLRSIEILMSVQHAYIALHPGVYPAQTALSESTTDHELIQLLQTSFPPCSTPGHGSHPASNAQIPYLGSTADWDAIPSTPFHPANLLPPHDPAAPPQSYVPTQYYPPRPGPYPPASYPYPDPGQRPPSPIQFTDPYPPTLLEHPGPRPPSPYRYPGPHQPASYGYPGPHQPAPQGYPGPHQPAPQGYPGPHLPAPYPAFSQPPPLPSSEHAVLPSGTSPSNLPIFAPPAHEYQTPVVVPPTLPSSPPVDERPRSVNIDSMLGLSE